MANILDIDKYGRAGEDFSDEDVELFVRREELICKGISSLK